MDTKCYVTGCKSGSKSCKGKVYFFKPSEEKTLNLWQKAINRKDLKLENTHTICHKHFHEVDIIKQKRLQGVNGPIMVDLQPWKLVKGAIPKLLLGNLNKPLVSKKTRKGLPRQSSSGVQNNMQVDHIKEVSLPSSWYWQEECLKKGQFICSKFQWLGKENNSFEYIKSIIVEENSIRYFVRGRNVVNQNLRIRFSTAMELVTVVKHFDEIPLCDGCTDPRLSETGTRFDAVATQKIRSKNCLLLSTGNRSYCSECYSSIESLQSTTANQAANNIAIKPSPSNSMQNIVQSKGKRHENALNVLPKIILVDLTSPFPTEAPMPLSDITNQHEEPGVSLSLEDPSHELASNITNNRSVALTEKSRNETPVENTVTVDRYNQLSYGRLENAIIDLEILPDRQAVTIFQNFPLITNSSASTKNLEQCQIKRPILLRTSNFPLRLYLLHTWCYGIYSPSLKPFSVFPEVDQDTAQNRNPPFVTNSGTSRPPSYLISRPVRVYMPRKNIFRGDRPLRNGDAVLKLNDIKDMKTYMGKIHVTVKGEPLVKPDLFQNIFHVENAAALRKSISVLLDDTQSDEDKKDLELALKFLREESRVKTMLLKRISRLSQQLQRHKKIAHSILKKVDTPQHMLRYNETTELGRPVTKKKRKISGRVKPKTECKVCGKVVLASRLSMHLKIHSGFKSHLCDICGRAFLQRHSLSAHIRYNHKGVKRPKTFLCTTCGFATDSKHRLEIHERSHTDERPFECQYCDKRFRQKASLNRHIRIHTGEKPYKCNICETSYSARSTYVMHHRRIHEKEKFGRKNKRFEDKKFTQNYQCEFCQKGFCRVLSFERHRATHTGLPVAVRCGQVDCDFTYSSVSQLKDHMAEYHRDKIFPCSLCSNVFFSKWNLSNHMSKHDPSLGFQCSYCSATLTTKVSLKIHEKIHTRDNPLECSICQMSFHSQFLLKRHMCGHRSDQSNRKRSKKPYEKSNQKSTMPE